MNRKTGAALLLAAAISFTIMPARAKALDEDRIMKIGLYYGVNALPSANLANEVGSGYSVGYFDSDRNFNKIHTISEEKISVMKDKTVYLGGDDLYYDTLPASSKGIIGAFHLQTDESFASDSEAVKAAAAAASKSGYCAFPAFVNGENVIRIGNFTSASEASEAASKISTLTGCGLSPVGMSKTCFTFTATKSTEVLYEFDNGCPLGIMPVSGGEKSVTWFKGYKYYGGFEYNRLSGNDITVINVLSLSDYVKGVIPYEMNPSWPIEALKAQALCAKSYALSVSGKHRSSGFDLCNTDDCQVYRGTSLATDASDEAVDGVNGLGVLYDGEPAQTFFHSSNGGSTEDAANVWGKDIPYLKAVPDSFEDLKSAAHGVWTKTITPAQVTTILRNKGCDVSSVVSLYVDKFTDAGNVYRLSVKDANGKVTCFEREKARTILNSTANGTYVYSMRFTVSSGAGPDFYAYDAPVSGQSKLYAIGKDKSVKLTSGIIADTPMITSSGIKKPEAGTRTADSFTISGRGWGHNVGLSQWGARGMAEQGWDYEKIIKYYYTGVTISDF
ncbi:MAG: SpoIID/LytB domain-containing protein [Bacillota bacterium]|nr:SpoIID/LytB domain-containing protein [Bacillota bacterium]